ncbi:patatin-like phospholipase family protein [Microcoleus sp. FACHB-53]|nr:patatin-like phospholipase family protein [Microcoleus sp. FACHB-53]MBD2129053.1 patatin-like phospholipase family protein [Microcoleus sp. FACHB-1]
MTEKDFKFKLKILSIDGGGIRGIVPAKILAEIEKRTGKRICTLFNLIAGTSTGGILAAGLALPKPNTKEPKYTAADLINIYRERGGEIFYEPFLEKVMKLDDISRPKYSSDGRDKVLKEYFGNTPLVDALTEVFVTSYDIQLRTPVFFTSQTNKEERTNRYYRKISSGFTMHQAAMATSAAPTYFKPHKVEASVKHETQGRGFYALVDGGVFANNPTSLALMEAIIDSKKPGKTPLELQDILVVSLGTGSLTRRYDYEKAANWGLVGWVQPLLNITLDGSSESVAVQLEQLLPKAQDRPPQYYRFQALLDAGKGLDDMDKAEPENIKNLEKLAEEIIAKEDQNLNALCKLLVN